jgi:hypothetical protein
MYLKIAQVIPKNLFHTVLFHYKRPEKENRGENELSSGQELSSQPTGRRLLLHCTSTDIAQRDLVVFPSHSHRPAVNQSIDVPAEFYICTPLFAHVLRNCGARDPEPLCGIALAHALVVYQSVNHLGPYTRKVFSGE